MVVDEPIVAAMVVGVVTAIPPYTTCNPDGDEANVTCTVRG
jgi:hypothetical protein